MEIKHCEYCGKELTRRNQKKFCDHSCSTTANNLKRGLRTIDCIQCGKTVIPKTTTRKYCSTKCQHLHKMIEAVTNNTASHKTIRRYLIYLHGERCLNPTCLWDFDKIPIVVELEHIDGNYRNNTIENCTLICPNCHTLTPTYKGKNKGNGRHSRRIRYHERKSY